MFFGFAKKQTQGVYEYTPWRLAIVLIGIPLWAA